jgi:hypothetical protein
VTPLDHLREGAEGLCMGFFFLALLWIAVGAYQVWSLIG